MKLLRMLLILIILPPLLSGPQTGRPALAPGSLYAAETETGAFNTDSYQRVLRIYVNEQGLVNYARLAEDRELLDNFVADIGALALDTYKAWPEPERLAFLINAYNAFTLRAVIDNYPIRGRRLAALLYPTSSIRQIGGVWDALTFSLFEQPVTLEHLENEILRVEFQEPRISMALARAALGGPLLRGEPYRGADLDTQLEDQTRRFLADPAKFKLDRDGGKIYLSPIFKWYGADFVQKYAVESELEGVTQVERAALNFIGAYLGEEDRKFIKAGPYKVKYLGFDWSLNEQAE